jgi:uncharacterized membrane protein YidH (DUF202 family)
MAAAILTLVLTIIAAGTLWLALGNRMQLHSDERQNDVLNLVVYATLMLPVFFVVVFFAMERF